MSLLFDLSTILEDFSDVMKKTIRYVYALSLLPRPKVAFHASDADGIVSAVILKNLSPFRKYVFIPLGYQELRHPEFGSFLSSVEWKAITDLAPFHTKRISLYCDHHQTSKELPKNADLVLFQAGAPSASFLLAQHFYAHLSPKIQLLAQLTVITDTASYTTSPPTKLPKDLDQASEEELAWLLDDLCRTVDSPEEILTLVQDLSSRQLSISDQPEYQERLHKLYSLRKESFRIADNIPHADVIIVIQGKNKVVSSSLVYRLFEKGVKLTCILYPGKRFTGLSFRVSSSISDSQLPDYRVDGLASEFSGGGHPRAAGGRSDSLQDALQKLNSWIEEKKLSVNVHDLRTV
ncbi:MAG: DHH family phosphoesterase [Promethearchaeota archaeon]|jgi:nanoRNase/pAp phosphatase (c-di-AMP/oligoRNAs hydrolase)